MGGGPFLNAVLSARFSGTGTALRDLCRGLETAAGSAVLKRRMPRLLDLDLLFVDPAREIAGLSLPHPRIAARRFVLVPLSEVWEGDVPGLGLDAPALLASCPDRGHINLTMRAPEPGGLWPLGRA